MQIFWSLTAIGSLFAIMFIITRGRWRTWLGAPPPFAILVVGLWSMEVALIDRREAMHAWKLLVE
jgi:hypothetical protein